MKIDSEHLEILAAIVEGGGLTEGAQRLGRSQPSVSRSMALLERRIGMPLFEPGRRPLRPTELGASLARLGAHIQAAAGEASRMVQQFRQGQAGRLRVGGSPIFMDGVISTLIVEFQARQPEVQIEQSYGYLDKLAAALRGGALDLAILPLHPAQVPQGMRFTPLLRGRNVIACRNGHPLARMREINLPDIQPYPWIAPPANSPLARDLQRVLKSIGREEAHVSFSGGTLASIHTVLTGSDCLTVLPYSVVFLARRHREIAALPLNITHPDRQLGMLVGTERAPLPAAERFAAFLQDACLGLQGRMDREQAAAARG